MSQNPEAHEQRAHGHSLHSPNPARRESPGTDGGLRGGLWGPDGLTWFGALHGALLAGQAT